MWKGCKSQVTDPLPSGPRCPGSPFLPGSPDGPFVTFTILDGPGNPGGPRSPGWTTELRSNACQFDS